MGDRRCLTSWGTVGSVIDLQLHADAVGIVGEFRERDVYALYIRTGEWKYVFYTRDLQQNVAGLPFNIKQILTDAPLRRRGDRNLYNLEADPYELNDLSQEPEHEAMMKDFRDEVFQWWEETGGAPIPESENGMD